MLYLLSVLVASSMFALILICLQHRTDSWIYYFSEINYEKAITSAFDILEENLQHILFLFFNWHVLNCKK